MIISWRHITPFDTTNVAARGRIAALEALRLAWQGELNSISEDERVRRRQRTLRRLAIETGILEKLYDLDWGLTLTLVAEGFARDVIERASPGRVNDWVLATLNAQRDSLEMVIDFVRGNRTLTPSFIKELHHAITRTQTHYEAIDALGRVVLRELAHGAWKTQPNHVVQADGTRLECCPPEQVDSEIERLVSWYEELETSNLHALEKAAWLHHRFVQIHPFADGNGRVARALTLLVMQRHHYAPLVVDRNHRAEYLKSLNCANDGDLNPLVTLFVNLESSALAGELEQAAISIDRSQDVAHTLAAQIAHRRERDRGALQRALDVRITAVFAVIRDWMHAKQTELRKVFVDQGVPDLVVDLFTARSDQPESPAGTPKHLFFRRQVIDSARTSGHYAHFGGFVGLNNLRISIEGMKLSFLVSLHGAGTNSSVMAATTFASIRSEGNDHEVVDIPTTSDAFYFSHEEKVEDLNTRSNDLRELLDQGLVVALAELMKRL